MSTLKWCYEVHPSKQTNIESTTTKFRHFCGSSIIWVGSRTRLNHWKQPTTEKTILPTRALEEVMVGWGIMIVLKVVGCNLSTILSVLLMQTYPRSQVIDGWSWNRIKPERVTAWFLFSLVYQARPSLTLQKSESLFWRVREGLAW